MSSPHVILWIINNFTVNNSRISPRVTEKASHSTQRVDFLFLLPNTNKIQCTKPFILFSPFVVCMFDFVFSPIFALSMFSSSLFYQEFIFSSKHVSHNSQKHFLQRFTAHCLQRSVAFVCRCGDPVHRSLQTSLLASAMRRLCQGAGISTGSKFLRAVTASWWYIQ